MEQEALSMTEADALKTALTIIDPGASNARAVARTLVDVIDGLRAQGLRVQGHPAVILIMCQLMQITGAGLMDPEIFSPAYRAAREQRPVPA